MFCSEFLPSSLFWLLILNVRREVCRVLLPTQTVRCNFCVDSTFSFQKIITLVTLRCSTGLSGQSEEELLCSVDTLLTTSCHPLLPLSSLHGGNSFSLCWPVFAVQLCMEFPMKEKPNMNNESICFCFGLQLISFFFSLRHS